jgi:hypothetical protein
MVNENWEMGEECECEIGDVCSKVNGLYKYTTPMLTTLEFRKMQTCRGTCVFCTSMLTEP